MAVERVYEAGSLNSESKLNNITSERFTRFTSAEIEYIVTEVETEEEAIDEVREQAPEVYQNMTIQGYSVSERCGANAWRVSANYAYVQGENTDDAEVEQESSFQFDTSGGTKHLTHSLATVSKASGSPDYKQAINYDGNSVQGVDVTMPVFNFSETHYFKPSKVSTSFKKKIAEMTGKVNSSSFKWYDKGEVLFLGASGSRTGTSRKDLWAITFKFAVSPNQSNLKVGDLNIGKKEGWQYLWVRFANDVDSSKENLVSKPIGAYVEQVYEYANLRGLGIGN